MAKIEQFIQLKDDSGIMKNLSELLQEARDKEIDSIFLGYVRKDDSTRVFWSGDKMERLNMLLDVMKNDLMVNFFRSNKTETYSEDKQ